MLHEFAIDPEALSNWQMARYLLEKFGVENGRIIAEYPKRWKRLVYQICESSFRPVDLKRIEEKLTDKLISTGRPFDPNLSWLDNSENQHNLKPFHAIISKSNPHNRNFVLIADDLDDRNSLFDVSRQIFVERKAQAIVNCVSKFLSERKEILFIDPHFQFENRFINTLKGFCSIINVTKIQRIEYHLNDSLKSTKYFHDNCDRLNTILPENIEITFFRWKQKEGGEKLHPRYILTDIGGVHFDCGLDEGKPGETTSVSLLENKVYEKVWRDFQKDTAAFELVDTTIVTNKKKRASY